MELEEYYNVWNLLHLRSRWLEMGNEVGTFSDSTENNDDINSNMQQILQMLDEDKSKTIIHLEDP